jgi:hypothetical protein
MMRELPESGVIISTQPASNQSNSNPGFACSAPTRPRAISARA